MARYDTGLGRERGQVRPVMDPMRAGTRGARYGRDFGRYDRAFPSPMEAPAELRGFRGGSASGYRAGRSAGPREGYERPRAPFFARGGGYDAGLRGGERGRRVGYGGVPFRHRGYDARW